MRCSAAVALCLAVASAGLRAHGDVPYDQVLTGPLVADADDSTGVLAVDVDADLDPDVLVMNFGANALFLNNGNAGFTKVSGDPVVTDVANSTDAVAADIDGDGDLDLYVTNGAENAMYVNQGGAQAGTIGTFAALAGDPTVTDVVPSHGADFGDVDGDGDPDLLVAHDGSTTLYVNQGGDQGGTAGTFLAAGAPFSGETGAFRDAALFDADGDGDQDAYVTDNGGNNRFFVNQGSRQAGTEGTFVKDTTSLLANDGGTSMDVETIDFDDDGDDDVFFTNFDEFNGVYVNQGNEQGGTEGTFVQIVSTPAFSQSGGTTVGIAFGDSDCDAHPEMYLVRESGSTNVMLDYTPNVGIEPNYDLTDGPPNDLDDDSRDAVFADFDMDGDLDLYVVNGTSGAGTGVNVYFRNSSPFSLKRNLLEEPFTQSGQGSTDVVAGDVDGDGDLDVYVTNEGTEDNALLENTTVGGGADVLVLVASGPQSSDGADGQAAAFGDVDGDADLDLVVANGSNQTNALYVNQGGAQAGVPGTFSALAGDPFVTTNAVSADVAAGDLDGDLDVDVLVANAGIQRTGVFVNQGGTQGGTEGTFVADLVGTIASSIGDSRGLALGDPDADADLDVYVANAGNDFLFLNDGTGGFSVAAGEPVVAMGDSNDGEFGDLDLDGDDDLYVVRDGENRKFAKVDGSPMFQLEEVERIDGTGPTAAALIVDFDADSDMDLYTVTTSGPNEAFCSGFFDDDADFSTGEFGTRPSGFDVVEEFDSRGLVVADLDDDGDLDLLVVNNGDDNRFYRGTVTDDMPWIELDDPYALEGFQDKHPHLDGVGTLEPQTPVTFSLADARPNTSSFLFIGLAPLDAPFKGGVLLPVPTLVLTLPTNLVGQWSLPATWPDGIPGGFPFYFHVWVTDVSGPNGFSASNGLIGTTPETP